MSCNVKGEHKTTLLCLPVVYTDDFLRLLVLRPRNEQTLVLPRTTNG